MIATEPRRDLVDAFRRAGGDGPRCVEIGLCWAESADEALATMHHYGRWSRLDWNVLPELATPRAFDAASKSIRREDLAETPHGPDVECYVDAIQRYVEAGFDELILHQIGPEQEGFFGFFASELGPALRFLGEARERPVRPPTDLASSGERHHERPDLSRLGRRPRRRRARSSH
jgi:hypothetical protein